MEQCIIDFDAASLAWRSNKRALGNGMFAYCCCFIRSKGVRCTRTVEGARRESKYATHPEWTLQTKPPAAEDPWRFCVQHRVRGPQLQPDKNP